MRTSIKKTMNLIFVFVSVLSCPSFGQEKYPLKQITFVHGEAGFFDWSPDSKSIVYSKQNGLWKFLINEEKPKPIIAVQSQHPSWSPDGHYIVFDTDMGKTISITSSTGGVPISIVPEKISIVNSGYPLWSPSGEEILFQGEQHALYLLEVQTGNAKKIIAFENLIPVPKSWSSNGKEFLISLRDNSKREANLWLISKSGEKKQLTFNGSDGYLHGDISPDGSLIVYSLYKDHKIWIMSALGGKSIQLTFSPEARDSDPKFSPDGKRIAFNRSISGAESMWMVELITDRLKQELKSLSEELMP